MQICKKLFKYYGSEMNVNLISKEGNSGLHYILRNRAENEKEAEIQIYLIKKLLSKGAQVNIANIWGETPLHSACYHGNYSLNYHHSSSHIITNEWLFVSLKGITKQQFFCWMRMQILTWLQGMLFGWVISSCYDLHVLTKEISEMYMKHVYIMPFDQSHLKLFRSWLKLAQVCCSFQWYFNVSNHQSSSFLLNFPITQRWLFWFN